MQGRLGVVVFFPVDDVKSSLASGQALAIEIYSNPDPGVAPTEVKIAKTHTSQVGKMGNSRLACRKGGIERDGSDNQNKVFHFDRKEKIEVDGPIGIDEPIG